MAILFSACSSSQPIPQWKDKSYRQLETYKNDFLADKEDATEPHFRKAREAFAAGNDLDLLAKAYLTRMALQAAVLTDIDDSDFIRLDKLQPSALNRSYYDFIQGNFSALQKTEPPPPYNRLKSAIAGKDVAAAAREIAGMENNLSRLIACGVWVKYLPYNDSILQIAIATASEQGWSRALFAYLYKLQAYYQDRKELQKAQDIKERLEMLKK